MGGAFKCPPRCAIPPLPEAGTGNACQTGIYPCARPLRHAESRPLKGKSKTDTLRPLTER